MHFDDNKSKKIFSIDVPQKDRITNKWHLSIEPTNTQNTLPINLKFTKGTLKGTTLKTEIHLKPPVELKKPACTRFPVFRYLSFLFPGTITVTVPVLTFPAASRHSIVIV